MTARDWPELVSTWRGLSIGDTIAIACWPDHAKVIDTIEYHGPRLEPPELRHLWPEPTVEWVTLWCRYVRDPCTRSRTSLRVDAAGRPVYRRWHNHLDADGAYVGHHVTCHPILILAPAPGRCYAQTPIFEGS